MTRLDAAAFAQFYREVHDYDPFPWQQELAAHLLAGQDWPDAIDVPTGLGKTSLLDVAVFTAAANAPAARRRTYFVVDRRLVVDEAFRHARKIAAALAAAASEMTRKVAAALRQPQDPGPVLEAVRMRGGATWSWRWVERPDRHTIVVGTVDQIGSRLLLRGYGVSEYLRPIDAALVGTDSLILVDEAHLAQAMLDTLRVAREQEEDRIRRVHGGASLEPAEQRMFLPTVVPVSATVPLAGAARVHRDSPADAEHPVAGPRLRAPRRLHLVEPKAKPSTAASVLAEQLAGWAVELAGGPDSGRIVLTVCNTVARARQVFETLEKKGVEKEQRVLLTGRTRPLARDRLIREYRTYLHLDERSYEPGPPFHIVATQTVEVGANIDADALVSESASLPALQQRLGRLARASERRNSQNVWTAPAVVVHDPTTGDDDPVYGSARNATWHLLCERLPVLRPPANRPCRFSELLESIPVSPVALRRLTDDLSAEQRGAVREPYRRPPLLHEATMQAWARTSPTPHPDPPIAPYLHGLESREPDVQLLWRADVREADLDRADTATAEPDPSRESLRILPPTAEEMLSLPVSAVRRWLEKRPGMADEVADVEGGAFENNGEAAEPSRRVLRYRGPDDIQAIDASQIRPADVLVVPTARGGCDDYGWAPVSRARVADLADLASRRHRPRVRLHARLLELAEAEHAYLREPLEDLVAIEVSEENPPDPEEYRTLLRRIADKIRAEDPEPFGLAENLLRLANAGRALRISLLAPTAPGEPDTVVLSPRGASQGSDEDESSSSVDVEPLRLDEHQQQVANQAATIARNLGLEQHLIRAVWLAGRYHDEGKRDPRFQAILHGFPVAELAESEVLAKSALNPDDRNGTRHRLRQSGYPPGMRHEGLSARIAAGYFKHATYDVDTDLVLHLIAAHHGRSRPLLPAVADPEPVTLTVPGTQTTVSTSDLLDWEAPARFARLNHTYGPWRLALLEAVVRLADIWCSAHQPLSQNKHHEQPRPTSSAAQRAEPEHTVALPALDGRDPLGFLTSLGLLRLLSEHTDLPVRLSFHPVTATAQLTSPLSDVDAIADRLIALVEEIDEDGVLLGVAPGWPPTNKSGKDPMRVPVAEFAHLAHQACEHGGRTALGWLSVIATDAGVDNEGRAALTPYMAPAGRQHVVTFFSKPLELVQEVPHRLREALSGWRRLDNCTGENLDHRVIRTAGDTPSGTSTPAGVPGATWLATQALPLLRLTGDGRRPTATLWRRLGRRNLLLWPVWRHPLDLHATQALLDHPALRPTPEEDGPRPHPRVFRATLAPLGILTVAAAERRPLPGGKSAGFLTPLPVRID